MNIGKHVFDTMYKCGVVPVVTLSEPSKAVKLVQAMAKGGVNVLEIAFRTENAAECIKAVRENYPETVMPVQSVSFELLTKGQIKTCLAFRTRADICNSQ